MKIAFYNVDLEYIDYLKQYETSVRGFTRVPNVNYRSGNNKFFYGTVLNINRIDYFVPISSKQHNRQDDIQIKPKNDKYCKEKEKHQTKLKSQAKKTSDFLKKIFALTPDA